MKLIAENLRSADSRTIETLRKIHAMNLRGESTAAYFSEHVALVQFLTLVSVLEGKEFLKFKIVLYLLNQFQGIIKADPKLSLFLKLANKVEKLQDIEPSLDRMYRSLTHLYSYSQSSSPIETISAVMIEVMGLPSLRTLTSFPERIGHLCYRGFTDFESHELPAIKKAIAKMIDDEPEDE